ncbi:hypothetical protein N9L77_09950, partial [Pseudomonadales bacterium]|nr:hypothetical protein [Pseudomonadales bacterium]
KNYNQPRREQRQQVIEAARQAGMLVVAEGGSLFHQDMNLMARQALSTTSQRLRFMTMWFSFGGSPIRATPRRWL